MWPILAACCRLDEGYYAPYTRRVALMQIRCTACVATLVLLCAFVMSERAVADAGAPSAQPVPGAAGAPASGQHPSEAEGIAGAAGEHTAVEEPVGEQEVPAGSEGEVADPEERRVVPEQAAVAEPLFAQPEARDVSTTNTEESANGNSGRRDFLRRLRSTAENIERLRDSEPTLVRTEGDVTVLTNVAPLERPTEPTRSRPVLAIIPAAPTSLAEPSPPSADALTVVPEVSRTAEEPPGHWHWLWILAGVATVLLVPIGMLLTRATRNS